MLTSKQAQKRIEKYYNNTFKKYEEHIDFYPDTENKEYYYWNMEIGNKRITIACNKTYGYITLL